MGFFGKLKDFDNAVSSIKDKKDELKELTDKSKRDEEDIKNIKKSKIWSIINLIFAAPFGVGLFFTLREIFSSDFLFGFLGTIALFAAYGTSLFKAKNWTKENAPSLGAIVFANILFYGMIVIIGVVVLLEFILVKG